MILICIFAQLVYLCWLLWRWAFIFCLYFDPKTDENFISSVNMFIYYCKVYSYIKAWLCSPLNHYFSKKVFGSRLLF